MGVTTGWGGTARLVAIVGPGVAASWLLSAATIDSAAAVAAGFVERVVGGGESVDAACAWIDAVSAISAEASRAQLALVRDAGTRLEAAARAREARAFVRLWNGDAHHAAVARFLDRSAAAPSTKSASERR